jgi:hypothetical protein
MKLIGKMWSIFEKLGCPSRKRMERNAIVVEVVPEVEPAIVNDDETTNSSEHNQMELHGCEVIRVKYGENKEYDAACIAELEGLLNPYLRDYKVRALNVVAITSKVCVVNGVDVMIEFEDKFAFNNIIKNIIDKVGGLKYKTYFKGGLIVFKKRGGFFRNRTKTALVEPVEYAVNIRTDFNRQHNPVIIIECDA